jgi:hypothetical protein
MFFVEKKKRIKEKCFDSSFFFLVVLSSRVLSLPLLGLSALKWWHRYIDRCLSSRYYIGPGLSFRIHAESVVQHMGKCTIRGHRLLIGTTLVSSWRAVVMATPPWPRPSGHTRQSLGNRYTSHHPMDRLKKLYIRYTHIHCAAEYTLSTR